MTVADIHQLADAGEAQAQEMDQEMTRPLWTPNESSARRFRGKEPPPRRYLLQNVLPLGKLGLMVAPGGTGKSFFALQLAMGVASGISVCDGAFEVGETGPALCLFAEDDEVELHRRYHDCVRELLDVSGPQQKALEKNLHLRSLAGDDTLLTMKQPSGEIIETRFFERLGLTLGQYKDLKLVIIDPGSRFRGGDENFANDATRFVQACEAIVKSTGATVLVVHHTNKASTGQSANQNAARGSSALVDGVRFVMNLTALTDKELKDYPIQEHDRHRYLRVTITKNNYAPPLNREVWLERGKNGVLKHVPPLRTVESCEENARKKVIVERIKSDVRAGQVWSRSGFIKEHSGTRRIFGVGKDKLERFIKELIDEGTLAERPASPDEKKAHRNLQRVLCLANRRRI